MTSNPRSNSDDSGGVTSGDNAVGAGPQDVLGSLESLVADAPDVPVLDERLQDLLAADNGGKPVFPADLAAMADDLPATESSNLGPPGVESSLAGSLPLPPPAPTFSPGRSLFTTDQVPTVRTWPDDAVMAQNPDDLVEAAEGVAATSNPDFQPLEPDWDNQDPVVFEPEDRLQYLDKPELVSPIDAPEIDPLSTTAPSLIAPVMPSSDADDTSVTFGLDRFEVHDQPDPSNTLDLNRFDGESSPDPSNTLDLNRFDGVGNDGDVAALIGAEGSLSEAPSTAEETHSIDTVVGDSWSKSLPPVRSNDAWGSHNEHEVPATFGNHDPAEPQLATAGTPGVAAPPMIGVYGDLHDLRGATPVLDGAPTRPLPVGSADQRGFGRGLAFLAAAALGATLIGGGLAWAWQLTRDGGDLGTENALQESEVPAGPEAEDGSADAVGGGLGGNDGNTGGALGSDALGGDGGDTGPEVGGADDDGDETTQLGGVLDGGSSTSTSDEPNITLRPATIPTTTPTRHQTSTSTQRQTTATTGDTTSTNRPATSTNETSTVRPTITTVRSTTTTTSRPTTTTTRPTTTTVRSTTTTTSRPTTTTTVSPVLLGDRVYINDFDGPGAPGVVVGLWRDTDDDQTGDILVTVQSTDDDGNYSFTAEPGCYSVLFEAGSGGGEIDPRYGARSACLDAGESDMSLDSILLVPEPDPPTQCVVESIFGDGVRILERDQRWADEYVIYDSSGSVLGRTGSFGSPIIVSAIERRWVTTFDHRESASVAAVVSGLTSDRISCAS